MKRRHLLALAASPLLPIAAAAQTVGEPPECFDVYAEVEKFIKGGVGQPSPFAAAAAAMASGPAPTCYWSPVTDAVHDVKTGEIIGGPYS